MTTLRSASLVGLCALALACSACSSNNTGKIEGKWKFVSGAGIEKQAKDLEVAKAYLFFEFKNDGGVTMGVESSDPTFQKLLAGSGEKTTMSFKYRLLSGNGVEFYGMPKEMQEKNGGGLFGKNKDKARTDVTIAGDDMTWKDSDGSVVKLTKVK